LLRLLYNAVVPVYIVIPGFVRLQVLNGPISRAINLSLVERRTHPCHSVAPLLGPHTVADAEDSTEKGRNLLSREVVGPNHVGSRMVEVGHLHSTAQVVTGSREGDASGLERATEEEDGAGRAGNTEKRKTNVECRQL
jgi:hypothetical protein